MSTKLKTIPLPAGLAPLPKGSVYLGHEIPQQAATFKGWTWSSTTEEWKACDNLFGGFVCHYAAPRDSAIAREILGIATKPKKAAKTITRPAKTVTKQAKSKKTVTLRRLPKNVKPGTRVVCVETGESGDGRKVLKGETYTASPSGLHAMIVFNETGEWMWHSKSFRLAPAKKRVRVTGLPSNLPQDLPPVPRGYDHWEYGGTDSPSLELSCALLIQDDGSNAWKIAEHRSHIRTPFCIPVKRVQRTKKIGVMPAVKPQVNPKLARYVADCEKFGTQFASFAAESNINLPDWLPALPPVPAGFDRWEPRGMGWAGEALHGCMAEGISGWYVASAPQTGEHPLFFYIEAVRDEKAEDSITKAHATLDAYSSFMERPFDAPVDNSAVGLLNEAAATIGARAAERDVDSERSMAKCVAAFNVMFGKDITEEQGWRFMELLKMSRSTVGKKRDDYLDGAAYCALAGETANKTI
jgi:hypothetical protein